VHRLQHLRLILHQLSSAKDTVFHLGRLKLRNRIITTTHSQRVVLVVMHLRTPIQYGRTQREVLHHALKGKFCTVSPNSARRPVTSQASRLARSGNLRGPYLARSEVRGYFERRDGAPSSANENSARREERGEEMCVLRCPTTRAVLERNDCGTPLSMIFGLYDTPSIP
jgi:hypothetical protein